MASRAQLKRKLKRCIKEERALMAKAIQLRKQADKYEASVDRMGDKVDAIKHRLEK